MRVEGIEVEGCGLRVRRFRVYGVGLARVQGQNLGFGFERFRV